MSPNRENMMRAEKLILEIPAIAMVKDAHCFMCDFSLGFCFL